MLHYICINVSCVLILYIITCSSIILSISIKVDEKDIGKRVTKRQVECLQRCQRIFERMLQKEGTNVESINKLITISDTFKNITNNRNICWESMDLTDCLKHCSGIGGSVSVNWLDFVIHPTTRVSTLAIPKYIVKQLPWFKPLLKRCLPYVESQKSNFLCISKYRSFMGIKCSAYKKEAETQYKNIKTQKEYIETCRFIHYHQNCLSTTVLEYCPNARRLFNSQTIRKYFLSHMLPDNDLRFDDEFLDNCKLKQKEFENVQFDEEEKIEDMIITTTIDPQIHKITTKRSTEIFLSTGSLEDIPPKFAEDNYGRYSVYLKNTTPFSNKYTSTQSSREKYVGGFTDDQEVKPLLYEIGSGSIVNNIEDNQNKSFKLLIDNKSNDDIFSHDKPILDGKVYIKKIRHFGESKKDPDFDMQDTEIKNITFEEIKKHSTINNEDRFTSYDYTPHNNIFKKKENIDLEESIISDPESFAVFVCICVFLFALLFYLILLCCRKRCNKNVRCGR
uniref:Apple domain-containing protein n=1 Tax=Strongyloides venezuelensis TaxID=75913 RepID=A0A0K0F9H7_STRVS